MAIIEQHIWNPLKRRWVIASYWAVIIAIWLNHKLFQPVFPIALTVFYFLCIAAVSVIVIYKGDTRPLTSSDSTLFSTVGAMIAGMFAIVFALRILLIQNAANTFSSGLFAIMTRDRTQNVIYWSLAIMALINIVIAGILTSSPWMVPSMTTSIATSIAIIISGLSFYLIFKALNRAYSQVNPLLAIDRLKRILIWEVSRIGKFAELHADYLQAKTPKDITISDSRRLAVSFTVLAPSIAKVSSDLKFLFDYHDKLLLQKENTAAQLVLNAIHEIAMKYVEIRRNSFFLVPSSEPFVPQSDSNVLFRNLLEQFDSKARQYMRAGDDEGIRKIIWIMESLTVRAAKLKFVGELQRENPIVEQCRFQLGLIINEAIKQQHIEGLYQGVKSLGHIGQSTAKAGLHLEANPISISLNLTAYAGIHMHQEIIWIESLNSFSMLLEAYATNHLNRHFISLTSIFNYLLFTLVTVFDGIGRSLINVSTRGYSALSAPFGIATRVIYKIAGEVRSEDSTHIKPSDLIKMCDEYCQFLRKLSERIKSADSHLIRAAVNSILYISKLLLEKQSSPEFKRDQEKIQRSISWLLSQIGWFAEHAEEIKNEHDFDALVESAAKIGLHASQVDNEEIATKAVKVIKWLSIEYAETTGKPYYGFVVPRIIERACFVGILALQRKQGKVIELLREVVAEIEDKAKEQVAKELGTQSEKKRISTYSIDSEVGQLYDTCQQEKYNPNSLDESSQSILFTKIECRDIDKFCKEIWGFTASERYTSSRLF